jgi:hypothetical protein
MSICLNPYYMKFHLKNIQFITALLTLAAVYVGCTKGPDIKTYTYPAPEPKAIFPDSGYAGFAAVTITGSQFGDFKNAVKVFFNGIPADTILSCEDGKIVARVPATAVSGKVSLQVWTNTIDSIGEFTIIDNPIVTTANKDIGLPGEIVKIAGKGFGSDPTKVRVSFNGTDGTVAAIDDTTLNVVLPHGFSSGAIKVFVNDFPVTGPLFRAVATVPDPVYWLSFENDLNDRMGGTAATYTQGLASPIAYEAGKNGLAVKLAGYANTPKGNNQIIALPPNISKHKEITVACWVNWTNAAGLYQEPIFDFGQARGNRMCLMTRMNTSFGSNYNNLIGRIIFEKIAPYTTITYYNAVGTQLGTNDWHHVALVISTANQLQKVYMDGIEVASLNFVPATVDPTLFNHSKVYIGAPTNGVDNEPAFGGKIDEFEIFNQALNADQIYADYYKNR